MNEKMKTFVRNATITIFIVLGVGFLALGYYGFVPGLSSVLGSSKPRDLRIETEDGDAARALEKAGVSLGALPGDASPEDSLAFEGAVDVVQEFTDEEVTAITRAHRWKNDIAREVQVRFNADGTQEMSGILRLDHAYAFARARKIPLGKYDLAVRWLEAFKYNPAFYVKAKTGWKDGHLALDVIRIELGRLELPPDWFIDDTKLAADIEANLLAIPELKINDVTFGDGTVSFSGTLPVRVNLSPSP